MAPREDDPERLDLSRFSRPAEALALAADGCPGRYTDIAGTYLSEATSLTTGHLLFASMISRGRGLHEATVREIRNNNPHAVFVLTRAYAELLTLLLYVIRKPDYIEVAVGVPHEEKPRRKKFEAMFHAVRDDAPGLKRVYRELSDFGHFSPRAVFAAHVIVDDEAHETGWTDRPTWTSEREYQIACAQIEEAAEAAFDAFDRFGQLILLPPYPTPVIGTITESRRLDS